MLVYDDFEPTDGQSEVYGLDLKAHYGDFMGEVFGFYGRLIDDFDWKTNLSQAIEDYDDLGDPSDKTHYWYGGRFEYNKDAIHFRTELASSKDGLLGRIGQYTQASYTLGDLMGLKSMEALVRYDVLNIDDIRPVNGNAITWDREMTTIASLEPHKFDQVKIEYYIMDETTGDKDTNSPVVNNEVCVSVERFVLIIAEEVLRVLLALILSAILGPLVLYSQTSNPIFDFDRVKDLKKDELLFVVEIPQGSSYKLELRTASGNVINDRRLCPRKVLGKISKSLPILLTMV